MMLSTDQNQEQLRLLQEVVVDFKGHLQKLEGMLLLVKWVAAIIAFIYTVVKVLEAIGR